MPDPKKPKKDEEAAAIEPAMSPQSAEALSTTTPTNGGEEHDHKCQPVCIEKWPEKTPLQVEPTGTVDVSFKGSAAEARPVDVLWKLLHRRARSFAFDKYKEFIDEVLCQPYVDHPPMKGRAVDSLSPVGLDSYLLLRTATEAYLLSRTPTLADLAQGDTKATPQVESLETALNDYLGGAGKPLPFITRITRALTKDSNTHDFFCQDSVSTAVLHPYFLELIWSYWMEEGALVQAINAIALRFQNKSIGGDRDPLANLEIHYLYPIANLMFGFIQDDDHRLTVARRAFEYKHQYDFPLVGKAVPQLRAADCRSKFLQAFHTLLHQVAVFYERVSNLTVRADGFPLLNSLREVHLILAEGAHNQFRDLPWTARVEMLIQQYMLARPEIGRFIGGRQAVPYAEDWMGPVDTLRRLMGWGETSVTHFRDLAVHGEQILLSIRYGDWSDANDEEEARGWALAFKPDIQRYIHAYQAVTGVDLGATSGDHQAARQISTVPPAILLQQRLARQKR